MNRKNHLLVGSALAAVIGCASPAHAQSRAAMEARLKALEATVEAQGRVIASQEAMLARHSEWLNAQSLSLTALTDKGRPDATSSASSASPTGAQIAQVQPTMPGPATAIPSPATVGEAPPETKVEVAALPEGAGVLTPRGRFVLDPAFEYTHGSSNRLVFRGVEIVTGLQIGVIEANDADRTALALTPSLRFGLTNRLELQATVPYLTRSDRITTLAQRDATISRTMRLEGSGLGDVEVGARYQINRARPGVPVLIASLQVKSDTGTSPFEVDRDEFGVASALATGSGFWGVSPGVSFIYPTDPAVIFGGISYLYHIPKDVNKFVGGALVGRVDPGDSISLNAGFGFALNPQFSTSMGFRYSYILPTTSVLSGTNQRSESLQVGSFMFGWSLRLTDRLSLSNNYEFGATSDAPDVRVVIRLPYRF